MGEIAGGQYRSPREELCNALIAWMRIATSLCRRHLSKIERSTTC
jgi:hypothetical protein